MIKIPSLLSLFIRKDGKINPSLKDIKEEAPKETWKRLGLNKTWIYFAPISLVLACYVLQYF